jgi:FkbM family methyltransferase
MVHEAWRRILRSIGWWLTSGALERLASDNRFQSLASGNRFQNLAGYAYLGDGVGLTLTHRGHKILVYTRDYALTPNLIASGEWERSTEDVILANLKIGDTVVEVGSNMGYHTLAMADKIGPQGSLYAFEANPELFRLLRWTLDLNGFLGRVHLFNNAAMDNSRDIVFQFDPMGVGGGHIVSAGTASSELRQYTVKGLSLDEALANIPNIDLLRMDAEGAESLILRGGRMLLCRSPNIIIITEWAPDLIRARGDDVEDAVAFLRDNKFYARRIGAGRELAAVELRELADIGHTEILLKRQ